MDTTFVSTLVYAFLIGLPAAFVIAAIVANVRTNREFDIED